MLYEKLFKRIRLLRWLIPLAIALLVLVYEIGPARWLYDDFGPSAHLIAEILFYGTTGPVLAFLLLDFLSKWLEEKETSDLQSQVLAEAREHEQISKSLSDDALQTLFAASIIIASLKTASSDLPSEATKKIDDTEQAIDLQIQKLRNHLQGQSFPSQSRLTNHHNGERVKPAAPKLF